MDKTREKRNLPPIMKTILATDVYMTNQMIKVTDKLLAFRQLKTHYKLLEVSCHGLLWIPTWIAVIWVFNNRNLYQMQINFLLGLLLDVMTVAVLKAFTRRRRPSSTNSLEIGPDKFSFPSGHASRAWYIACFFLYVWSVHFIFVPPLICWAVAVCISRIMMRRHHLLDIFVGAVLGVMEAFFIGVIYLDEKTSLDLIWWLTDEKLDGGEYHV